MKNKEVIEAANVLGALDNKGSVALRWAVSDSIDIITSARKKQIEFVNKLKPESLKKLEAERDRIKALSKSQKDFSDRLEMWEDFDDYLFELNQFEDSKKVEDWNNSDAPEGFKLHTLKAKTADLKGIEINSTTFKALRYVVENIESLMPELVKLRDKDSKEEDEELKKPIKRK